MKTLSSSVKKALIITFDLIRPTDPATPLAAAYLLAYLKSTTEYGTAFTVEYKSINILSEGNSRTSVNFSDQLNNFTPAEYDTIALGTYVWGDALVNPCISYLRDNGFTGKIVLGGSQITYTSTSRLTSLYPGADIFISGYAEEALRKAILSDKPAQPFVSSEPSNIGVLPSPFLTGEIPVYNDMPMVRMMTKRGCLYICGYCAHKELRTGDEPNKKKSRKKTVYDHNFENALLELELFRKHNVKRINVLDPVFNYGKTYLPFLRAVKSLQFPATQFTLQTRLELIRGEEGEEFLDLVQATGAHLEVGVQSINEAEYREIGRSNKVSKLKESITKLNNRSISYEASIIYGLPNQTVSSFQETINFLESNNCSTIYAYPLMLLRGTELEAKKDTWNLQEEIAEPYGIPVVVSSNSFNRSEWEEMNDIANRLSGTGIQRSRVY